MTIDKHSFRRAPAGVLAPLLALLAALSSSGCSDRDPAEENRVAADERSAETTAETAGADRQTAFRVRSDFHVELNDDTGWAGEIDEAVSVKADRPFRLRFEVTADGDDPDPRQYRLEMRRNGGDWQPLPAENFPQPEKLHEFPLESHDDDAGRIWHVEAGDATSMRWSDDEDGGYLEVKVDDQSLLALGNYPVHWLPVEFAA
jgi:hypothetical protein